MKPIKQTVCIATEETKNQGYSVPEGFTGKYGYFLTKQELNEYIAIIIKQTLEAAAEKAEMTGIAYGNDTSITDYEVDKQSITDTFEETFKQLKV